MGVELKVIIGHTWGFEEGEAFAEHHAKYGRGIHEIARLDLSGVDREVWAVVNKYQEAAQAEFDKSGMFYVIYTDAMREDDEGVIHEVNLSEDSYGKKIAAVPLEEFLAAVKLAQVNTTAPGGNYPGRGYRRYRVAIALIEAILADFPDGSDNGNRMVALTYGH